MFVTFATAVARCGEPPGTPPLREVSFSVFAVEPGLDAVYIPRPGAEPRPLEFYPTSRSSPQKYRGRSPLEIFDRASGATIASIELPREIRSALLIFMPSANPRSHDVRVIDDGDARHSVGETRVINLSGLLLEGAINQEYLQLPNGADRTIKAGNFVRMKLRTMFRERSFPSYAGEFELESGGRALVLLLPPYRAGSLEVQSRVLLDAPLRERR